MTWVPSAGPDLSHLSHIQSTNLGREQSSRSWECHQFPAMDTTVDRMDLMVYQAAVLFYRRDGPSGPDQHRSTTWWPTPGLVSFRALLAFVAFLGEWFFLIIICIDRNYKRHSTNLKYERWWVVSQLACAGHKDISFHCKERDEFTKSTNHKSYRFQITTLPFKTQCSPVFPC